MRASCWLYRIGSVPGPTCQTALTAAAHAVLSHTAAAHSFSPHAAAAHALAPHVTAAHKFLPHAAARRLESVALVMQNGLLEDMLDNEEQLTEQLDALPFLVGVLGLGLGSGFRTC